MTLSINEDFPHPVPHEAFMMWKENWCFSGIDTEHRLGVVFHFSLRPTRDEGIFTAKFVIDGEEYRSVQRSPIPRDVTELVPVSNGDLELEVLEPHRRFRVTYQGEKIRADIQFEGRFEPWDFREGVKTGSPTAMGEYGRTVFHFPHYEQGLIMSGTVEILDGDEPRVLEVAGFGNRDHSWGWRNDHLFISHHWINPNFEDRFLQGTSMFESTYPEPKFGGFEARESGNVGVVHIDMSDAYWLEKENEPIGPLDRDCTYVLTLGSGEKRRLTAHLSTAYGQASLNFRSRDRSKAYQDIQIFCDWSLPDEGLTGTGILEIGKRLRGPGVADLI